MLVSDQQSKYLALRIPQARVLKALMPDNPAESNTEWPVYNRSQLGVRSGYTAISGTITRALKGIKEGSSSGDAYPGLLTLGLIEEIPLNVEGVVEINYRITQTGVKLYQAYMAVKGSKLPPVKDAAICINERYLTKE